MEVDVRFLEEETCFQDRVKYFQENLVIGMMKHFLDLESLMC